MQPCLLCKCCIQVQKTARGILVKGFKASWFNLSGNQNGGEASIHHNLLGVLKAPWYKLPLESRSRRTAPIILLKGSSIYLRCFPDHHHSRIFASALIRFWLQSECLITYYRNCRCSHLEPLQLCNFYVWRSLALSKRAPSFANLTSVWRWPSRPIASNASCTACLRQACPLKAGLWAVCELRSCEGSTRAAQNSMISCTVRHAGNASSCSRHTMMGHFTLTCIKQHQTSLSNIDVQNWARFMKSIFFAQTRSAGFTLPEVLGKPSSFVWKRDTTVLPVAQRSCALAQLLGEQTRLSKHLAEVASLHRVGSLMSRLLGLRVCSAQLCLLDQPLHNIRWWAETAWAPTCNSSNCFAPSQDLQESWFAASCETPGNPHSAILGIGFLSCLRTHSSSMLCIEHRLLLLLYLMVPVKPLIALGAHFPALPTRERERQYCYMFVTVP